MAVIRFQLYQYGRLIGTYQIDEALYETVKADYTAWGLTVVFLERLEVGVPPTPRVHTYMEYNVSPTSGNRPLIVTHEGALYDEVGNPLEGKSIDIYRNDILVKTVTTGYAQYAGYFTTTDTIDAVGDYNCQARFAGDATYEGCVKDAPIPVTVIEIPVAVVPPAKPPAVPAAGALLLLLLLLMAKK